MPELSVQMPQGASQPDAAAVTAALSAATGGATSTGHSVGGAGGAAAVAAAVAAVHAHFAENQSNLPSLGSHAAQIVTASGQVMQASTSQLEAIIRRDPAISVELLKLANSPMYRRSSDVSSISDAIVRLGRQQVYSTVASVAARNMFESSTRDLLAVCPDRWRRVQNHCVACAFGTAWLVAQQKVADYEVGFAAGMFHDVGKLMALQSLGRLLLAGGLPFTAQSPAFGEALEQAQTPLGMAALSAWGLPTYLVEVCRCAHVGAEPHSPQAALVECTRLVSALTTLAHDAPADPRDLTAQLAAAQEALQLGDAQMKKITERVLSVSDNATEAVGTPSVHTAKK
jgi:HD-like signal output (HDOD) protein